MASKMNLSSATDILEYRANLSIASPLSSKKKSAKKPTGQLPHHKAGRVKVGIRCRPPFQEEIERAKGKFAPIIETRQDSRDPNALGKVALSLSTGKQREFMFDYVFGPSSSQDYVYDRVARPVVNDVLNGFNGTIFAYGQTGTGPAVYNYI
jgi:kinesin family member 11